MYRGPTMLLKTNTVKMKDFHIPTMLIKINGLWSYTQDVNEKTGGYE
jgi:hypothetical protein